MFKKLRLIKMPFISNLRKFKKPEIELPNSLKNKDVDYPLLEESLEGL